MKFIYAFTETDKIELLSKGYNFIREQVINGSVVYLFENNMSDEISTFVKNGKNKCLFTDEMFF